jgi:hypothetical protein
MKVRAIWFAIITSRARPPPALGIAATRIVFAAVQGTCRTFILKCSFACYLFGLEFGYRRLMRTTAQYHEEILQLMKLKFGKAAYEYEDCGLLGRDAM